MTRGWIVALTALLAGVAIGQPAPKSRRLSPSKILALSPTGNVIVRLDRPASATDLASQYGMHVVRRFRSDSRLVVLQPGLGFTLPSVLRSLTSDPRVTKTYPDYFSADHPRSWVPNDPLYFADSSAGTSGQWHLFNSVTTGLDANLLAAWAGDWTGTGVTIGIVDEGAEFTHPDLAANYDPADSFDFLDQDPNPAPPSFEAHGTAVAGIAAARGGNGIGGTGAAPLAQFASLRIPFGDAGDVAARQDATLYHSSGANRQIGIKVHAYGDTSPYLDRTAEADALVTSALAGTIHVWAAGNERQTWSQDSNTYWRERTPEVITVSALGSDSKFASYSNFGACLFVTAPSSTDSPGAPIPGITTVDRTGTDGYNDGNPDDLPDIAYTRFFGGTSASAPLVAGVMALGRQMTPTLDVRWAKHLLVRTSRKIDASDASPEGDTWRTNSAGFSFNQNYGFGLIDAGAFMTELSRTTGVSTLQTETVINTVGAGAIPDNNASGITRTFTVVGSTPLEEIQVQVDITHPFRGDLEAYVTSPRGTLSRLWKAAPNDTSNQDPGQNISWTFTSNAFWGENPKGNWKLRVIDTQPQDVGTLNSCSLTARMGSLVYKHRVDATVTLSDYVGSVASVPITVEVRDVGATAALATYTLTPDAQGRISFYVDPSGKVDLTFRASHWLRNKAASVGFGAGGVVTLAIALTNGDVNGDNQVSASDQAAFSLAYRSTPASPNWNPKADLNGDDQVSASDQAILSKNFRKIGAP